jgi:hypothetical protein
MADLSEVVQLIKSDLPNTKARLKKQTYRSVLIMKKRNDEIAQQLLHMNEQSKEKKDMFSKPHVVGIIEKEGYTLADLRANAGHRGHSHS